MDLIFTLFTLLISPIFAHADLLYQDREEILEHFVASEVPRTPLEHALEFYFDNEEKLKNKRFISIGDYSQSSKERRLYILDLETGDLQREYLAHGSGRNRLGRAVGDKDHDGYLNKCKHSRLSRFLRLVKHRRWGMTRPGFMRVDETYYSKKFDYGSMKGHNSIFLTGLSRTSRDVRKRSVVFHEASYVKDESIVQGRTLGCPAIPVGRMKSVMSKISGGSLYYSYVPQCN
jgi:hypothetical protein